MIHFVLLECLKCQTKRHLSKQYFVARTMMKNVNLSQTFYLTISFISYLNMILISKFASPISEVYTFTIGFSMLGECFWIFGTALARSLA